MVGWKCPHCGKEMYSSCEGKLIVNVKCINCGKTFKNPYFKNGCTKIRNVSTEVLYLWQEQLYKVMDDSGKLLSLHGWFGNEMVLRDQVNELPEDVHQKLQAEYLEAVSKLKRLNSVSGR
jgi:hypothetical protein